MKHRNTNAYEEPIQEDENENYDTSYNATEFKKASFSEVV